MKLKRVHRKKIIISIVSFCCVLAIVLGFYFFNPLNNDIAYPTALSYNDTVGAQRVKLENPVLSSTIESVNNFGYQTATKLITANGSNENYSPISLYYATAVAASGAKGDTLKELQTLLGFKDSVTFTKQCGNLYKNLYFDNQYGKLKIANSLWLQKDFPFEESFKVNAANNFFASSHNVDFASPLASIEASNWVKNATQKTLSPKINFDSCNALSIFNTVYFKDKWESTFEERDTKPLDFHTSDGKTVKCNFMIQPNNSYYFENELFSRSSLLFKNGGKMVFILPNEGVSIKSITGDYKKLKSAFEDGENTSVAVDWKIPKFSFNSTYNLIDTLKSLGVNKAFSINADFSGISNKSSILISDITQQTHITLKEGGVEASAFTKITFFATARSPYTNAEMILNRPFVYGIYSENGTLLFVGVCENPNA